NGYYYFLNRKEIDARKKELKSMLDTITDLDTQFTQWQNAIKKQLEQPQQQQQQSSVKLTKEAEQQQAAKEDKTLDESIGNFVTMIEGRYMTTSLQLVNGQYPTVSNNDKTTITNMTKQFTIFTAFEPPTKTVKAKAQEITTLFNTTMTYLNTESSGFLHDLENFKTKCDGEMAEDVNYPDMKKMINLFGTVTNIIELWNIFLQDKYTISQDYKFPDIVSSADKDPGAFITKAINSLTESLNAIKADIDSIFTAIDDKITAGRVKQINNKYTITITDAQNKNIDVILSNYGNMVERYSSYSIDPLLVKLDLMMDCIENLNLQYDKQPILDIRKELDLLNTFIKDTIKSWKAFDPTTNPIPNEGPEQQPQPILQSQQKAQPIIKVESEPLESKSSLANQDTEIFKTMIEKEFETTSLALLDDDTYPTEVSTENKQGIRNMIGYMKDLDNTTKQEAAKKVTKLLSDTISYLTKTFEAELEKFAQKYTTSSDEFVFPDQKTITGFLGAITKTINLWNYFLIDQKENFDFILQEAFGANEKSKQEFITQNSIDIVASITFTCKTIDNILEAIYKSTDPNDSSSALTIDNKNRYVLNEHFDEYKTQSSITLSELADHVTVYTVQALESFEKALLKMITPENTYISDDSKQNIKKISDALTLSNTFLLDKAVQWNKKTP
ncbi:MAG TPA: hypothetical protein VEK38_00845, partial [Candidatus Bathyarchaeia archaeon]|nr:hypothetical protein [Candidatus Bathyarchaeia archaeon]